jgi:hypothetical protein
VKNEKRKGKNEKRKGKNEKRKTKKGMVETRFIASPTKGGGFFMVFCLDG